MNWLARVCVLALAVWFAAANNCGICGQDKIEGFSLNLVSEQVDALYKQAGQLYLQGKYSQAASLLDKAAKLFKGNDPYLSTMRQTMGIKPDKDIVIKEADKFRDSDAQLRSARSALQRKEYSKAEQILLLLKTESPESAEIQSYLETAGRQSEKMRAKDVVEKRRQEELQAKEKIREDKRNKKSIDVQAAASEKEMISEVIKEQVVPYVEPPKRAEKIGAEPLVEPPAIRKRLQDTKVSLDFDSVDLKAVCDFLAQETGINFVISKKVLDSAPKVTVRFKDITVYEAVKYISKSLGLVYRLDKDLVWIADQEETDKESMENRVYCLKRGGGLFTEFSPVSSNSSDTGLGGSSAQITKVATIEDTLREVVPWPADSKLSFDKRINAIIVRNTPQNIQSLEDVLYNVDITPYQILIEARFIEIDITNTKELGIEWKLNSDLPTNKVSGNLQQGIFQGSGFDYSAFTRAAEGLNLTYKGVLTKPQFETIIHALDENKKIKTLSSPRITTLNNQLASIKVVDEWIYPTRYEYEIVQFDINGDGDYNDAGETTYKNVPKDFLRRDVGILLKVIPSVGEDKKTINLSLIPEVSEATADAFEYTGDVKLPKFTSRNLSTTIVVNSGDTVVLGGLIKENRTKILTRVPILGSIPFMGPLFRKETDSIERKNLMIFVTAKVLAPSGEEVVASGE